MDPQPQTTAPEDISPKTILVLVVLTLAISFIGAWVNITAAAETPVQAQTDTGNQAEVSFYIVGQEPSHSDATTGLVAFELQ